MTASRFVHDLMTNDGALDRAVARATDALMLPC
jgi:hypothetical protein